MENKHPTESTSEEWNTEKYIFPIVESERLVVLRENERKIRQRIAYMADIARAIHTLSDNNIVIPGDISELFQGLKK